MFKIILADYQYAWRTIVIAGLLIGLLLTFASNDREFRRYHNLFAAELAFLVLAVMIIPRLLEKRTALHVLLPLPIRKIALTRLMFLLIYLIPTALLLSLSNLLILPPSVQIDFPFLLISNSVGLVGTGITASALTEIKLLYPKRIRFLLSLVITIPLAALLIFSFLAPLGLFRRASETTSPISWYFSSGLLVRVDSRLGGLGHVPL